MEEYSLVNQLSITYYNKYHPHTKYIVNQTPYSYFMKNSGLVRISTNVIDDI